MSKIRVAILLAVVLAVPTGAAWSFSGSFEPDTPDDVTGGRMWADADTSRNDAERRVYFNVFPGDGTTLGAARPNPNVGAAESRVLPSGFMMMTGILGVWKDCNEDGYIGMAETALLHYRSELLSPDSPCPPDSYFNYNGWVTEFWSIGPQAQPTDGRDFPRIITDVSARMWGDFGRMDRPEELHFDCAQEPLPRGTTDSTGGLLLYADCQLGYTVADKINSLGNEQLAFNSDPEHECSSTDCGKYRPDRDCDSLLNQQLDTYGKSYCAPDETGTLESNTSDEMVTVFDCRSSPTRTGIANPGLDPVVIPLTAVDEDEDTVITFEDENGNIASVDTAALAPGLSNPDGSLADTVNNVEDGSDAVRLHYTIAGTVVERDQDEGGACDSQGEYSNFGPGETELGANFAGTNPADGKRTADFNMTYGTFGSGVQGTNVRNLPQQVRDANTPLNAFDTIPTNAGLQSSRAGNWASNVIYLPPPYTGLTVRESDRTQPAPAMWFTFYADLSTTGLSLPPGATEAYYGANENQCGTDTDGIRNKWDCNPDNWWKQFTIETSAGAKAYQAAGAGSPPVPGRAYRLLDVDCYDGSVVSAAPAGVGAGLTLLSDEGPCPAV